MQCGVWTLSICLAFIVGTQRVNAQLPGHLITVPRNLWSGELFTYCLTIPVDADLNSGPVGELSVGVTLVNKVTNATTKYLPQVFFKASDVSKCYKLPAPDVPGSYYIKVSVNTVLDNVKEGKVYYSDESSVEVRDSSTQQVTLIQTDKPLYKPGQTVKFRIMKLKKNFRPVLGKVPFVAIENPSGVRVMQWKNVDLSKGIASLEMPLSADPPLGMWNIKVTFRKEVAQSFEVKEYVLPKFEVSVTPPPFLLPTSPTIDGKVCGKYTYGKPVKGVLELKVCYERTHWWGFLGRGNDPDFERPCANHLLKINGCENFSINSSEIYLNSQRYSRYGQLIINATITEDGTGVMINGQSTGPAMKFYPFDLKMEDDTSNYFKAVFPYKGRVLATQPDGSPAVGETIEVSVSDYSWDAPWSLRNTFVTDSNGKVEFSIEDVPENVTRFSINAKAPEYEWTRYSSNDVLQLYQPTAHLSIQRWYSPSNSFIQIEDIAEPVACGQDLKLSVLYSTPPNTYYKMHVVVTSGSDVVHTSHHTHHFKIHDAVDFKTVNKSNYLVRYYPTRPPPVVFHRDPLIPPSNATDSNSTEPVVEDTTQPEYAVPLLEDDLILNRKKRQTVECIDFDGNKVQKGERYKPDVKSPCKMCVCDSVEEEVCFTAMCVPPPCPNYRIRPRECCAWDCLDENGNVMPPDVPPPSPKDCQDSNGTLVQHGERYQPLASTPCRSCMCQNGKPENCQTMMCSPPPCKNFVMIDGTCCGFKCIGNLEQVCLDKDGAAVKEGDEFFPDSSDVCKSCVCTNGVADRCATIMCDEPPCPFYELIEGTCCGFQCLDSPPLPAAKPPSSPSEHIARVYLKVPITASMAPKAKVMVYFVKEDMETVASSREFSVEKCFDNKVKLEFENNSVKPGSETSIKLKAEPGSVCSVGVVDKSMQLLKPDHEMTADKFYKLISQIEPYYYYYGSWRENNLYCEQQLKDEIKAAGNESYGFDVQSVDALQAFRSMDMMVFSNLKVETRPCKLRKYRYSIRPMAVFNTRMEGLPGPMDLDSSPEKAARPNQAQESAEDAVRSFFPETWLWDIEVVGDTGEIVMKRNIPDTITEWIGNSICTSATAGVGIAPQTSITAFQPFFLSFTLPYSAVRGETLPLLVTVFNYLTECLTMQVDILQSPDFQLNGMASRTQCVCGGESSTFKFYISPNTLGKIQIQSSARSIPDDGTCDNNVVISVEGIGSYDAVRRDLLVEAEGIEKEYTYSSYVCPSGSTQSTEVSTIDLPLPNNTVPGSARGMISVIGDVMGPALSNLQDLLRMPYGCGEQNMASFAPNIFALQYLSNTNQETPGVVEEAKRYMRVGYQRQLRYRHPDGSYSAWGGGEGTTGSMWLTAFVVKCLGQSIPYIDIDERDLNKSISWFKQGQLESGCFPKIGYTHSYYLKGGYSDRSNEAIMTAFVIIAMMEAGFPKNDQAILDGIRCLDIQTFNDTYTLAVVAYAYSLFDISHPRRKEIMTMLMDVAKIQGEMMYWERQEEENKTESRYAWLRAPSAEIEITSYAMLANIVGNQPNAAINTRPIVMWLSKQRNSQGGFGSTQDTIIALQALSKYATLVYQDGIDLTVGVTGSALSAAFGISDENNLLLQSQSIDTLPNTLTSTVKGVGCALVQANVKYNIPREIQRPSFELKIGNYRVKNEPKSCAKRKINICVRFSGEGGVSNMAIVDVKMQTGWIPVKDSLKKLLQMSQQSNGLGLQKYETDGNVVHLYFDEFDGQRRCFFFLLEQNIRISNPKPAYIKVYDYYETELNVIGKYDIKTICGTKEELPFISPEEYAFGNLNPPFVQMRQPGPLIPMLDNTLPVTCPKCLDALPLEDSEKQVLICNARNIYKLRTGKGDNMKLYADLKPRRKIQFGKFVTRLVSPTCRCNIISSAKDSSGFQKFLVFTLSKVYKEKEKKIELDDNSTIVKYTRDVEKQVFKRNKRC